MLLNLLSSRFKDTESLMCGLCGALGGERHWSDAGDGRSGGTRLRRLGRIRLLAPLVGYFGLALRDMGANRYVLRGREGNLAQIDNLAGLWPAVERATGRTCDPLEPELLAFLERAGAP
jgi:hypothetical protein